MRNLQQVYFLAYLSLNFICLVDFRKLVIEQTNNEDDVDWEKLLPFNTAKDLFTVLTANEIRMLRDTNPNVSFCYNPYVGSFTHRRWLHFATKQLKRYVN